MPSLRNQEKKKKKALGEFLDEHFYKQLVEANTAIKCITRTTDKDEQLAGVDVCIEMNNGKKYYIDEKAAFYYSNVMIPTFAFEIDSIQKNDSLVLGWFLNEKLKTQYYFLVWPNIKCEKKEKAWIRKPLNKVQKTDFTIVEAMVIEKEKLLAEVEKNVGSREHLLEYAKKIRGKAVQLDNNQLIMDDNYKFVLSEYIHEKPINLVIKKEVLKKLADAKYLISQDGSAKLSD